jgi:DNA-binding beta-propeller fold protein YncE
VAVSANDQLAFVSLAGTSHIAVFNLHQALTRGFGPADYIGAVPVGLAPTGLAVSPDGGGSTPLL